MLMDRSRSAELGQETVQILINGYYQTKSGAQVEISRLIRHSQDGTCSYPPDHQLPNSHLGDRQTQILVENETTLEAAQKLTAAGYRPVALNFASATSPGGGFLRGARAQEESLARSSGLYACLEGNEMYRFHRSRGDLMYTDYAIYSPDVPVIRSDDGTLLEQPYLCSFITCPAVIANHLDPARRPEIPRVMWSRVLKVLAVAVNHSHEDLVLGAWGCGAFGNDPEEMAKLFDRALRENFRGAFSRVVFAIVDWSTDGQFIGPFRRAFEER